MWNIKGKAKHLPPFGTLYSNVIYLIAFLALYAICPLRFPYINQVTYESRDAK